MHPTDTPKPIDWRAVRVAAGVSGEVLAVRAGVSLRSLRRFEAGDDNFRDLTRSRLELAYRALVPAVPSEVR